MSSYKNHTFLFTKRMIIIDYSYNKLYISYLLQKV